ncbi:MAG: ribosomal protein S18-alanine N-acetyltransferase [candidate division WOR-3 bacterium]|nr:ribosomal protein S18-alanine N-acetyltransferase [candidate division WOR-3 bacterium]
MKIYKMSYQDLDQVMDIENSSFKDPWKRDFFEHDLCRRSAMLFVAKEGPKVIGYIDAWLFGDELHLANIAVHPEFRRMGVGSKLLKKIIELGKTKNAKYMVLEVRKSNFGAQKFYEKLGFKQYYLRPRYYSNGEDAIVYKLDL